MSCMLMHNFAYLSFIVAVGLGTQLVVCLETAP